MWGLNPLRNEESSRSFKCESIENENKSKLMLEHHRNHCQI